VPIGEYVSPDGQLKFTVICVGNDRTMGFDGFPWHMHGSILAEISGSNQILATERYIADLVGNISVIALKRVAGVLRDIWITNDPVGDLAGCKRYGVPEETVEFRFWNGVALRV
jgi:hypothetical protein